MTKAEFITMIAKKTGQTKATTASIIDAVFEGLADVLANGESFTYPKFGAFVIKTRAARRGKNPFNGDAIDIPEKKAAKFKMSNELKKRIQNIVDDEKAES